MADATMQALILTKSSPSSPPSLSTTTLPIPKVNPGYALVKICAARINPSDVLNMNGSFPYTTFPRVPGRDYAGIVVDGPPELISKKVYGTSGNAFSFTEDGAHAEYALVKETALAPMPSNLSYEQAAMLGVPWTTASVVLNRGHATANEYVLVLGANGAVGSAVVELALERGCKVITASRRSTTDVNTVEDSQLSKVLSITNGHGADCVVDTVGDPVLMSAALGVLARKGRISYIAAPRSGSTSFTFDMTTLYRKEHSIVGCNSLNYTPDETAEMLRSLTPAFEKGSLSVSSEDQLTIVKLGEEAVGGYAQVKGHSGMKVVIVMD
jgi:NADPH:quinone reductase